MLFLRFVVLMFIIILFSSGTVAKTGLQHILKDPNKITQLRPTGPIPNQYIVVFKKHIFESEKSINAFAKHNDLAKQYDIEVKSHFKHALKGFSANMSAQMADKMRADPRVDYIEQDIYAYALEQTVPAGIHRIGAVQNSIANIDGEDGERVDIDIAIIDTGIDLDHPDLNVYRDVTFVKRTDDGDDDNGHGTHVAGSAAAIDNDSGVVGVAPGARLWAVKVLNRRGSGSFSDIIKGIDYVTANAGEIEVANMSLGGVGKLDSLRTAIQESVNAGVVYVVAAGNESRDVYGPDGDFNTSDDSVPAAYPEVMTVSAMVDTDGQAGGSGSSTDDTFAYFSNYSRYVMGDNPVTSTGAAIDLAAPGVNILSTWKNGEYNTISGTSMASPHVAGAVALYIAANSRASNSEGVAVIRQAMIDNNEPQLDWRSTNTLDQDDNKEGLVNVGGTITSNEAPVVTIINISDNNGENTPFNSGVTISYDGTAGDAEDGILTANLIWDSNIDGQIGVGGKGEFSTSTLTPLSDGNHTITASITDSGGKMGSASISIIVGTSAVVPVAEVVTVDSITYGTTGGRNNNRNLLITINLIDDLEDEVSGASVSIDLFLGSTKVGYGTASTSTIGSVTFELPKAAKGIYSTTVTNVSATGLNWDGSTPSENTFTKD